MMPDDARTGRGCSRLFVMFWSDSAEISADILRCHRNMTCLEKLMDLFVRNGSAEISRPLVIRSKYDLLGETYGPVCLERFCRN